MSENHKFQEIVVSIREDLVLAENLYWILHQKLLNNPFLDSDFSYMKTAFEVREWVFDVLLDKIYDIDSKILKFLTDVSSDAEVIHKKFSIQEVEKLVRELIHEKQGLGHGKTYENLNHLKLAIANYRHSLDIMFDGIRKVLYAKNWAPMKKISIEDYMLTRKRRKYITAREELETAKQMIKNGKYEEVLNHIRPALEIAIRERFGFTRFLNFWKFLRDADELNFPIPAFDMLYFYYGVSSGRLHAGKLSNPFECQTALGFAGGFIDRLELVTISKEDIDNFKENCNWVK